MNPASKTAFDARALAREYIHAGFAVVSISERTKGPVLENWQHLRIGEAEISRYFQKTSHIGLLLGLNGIVDIDLDCPESVRIGAELLPWTPATFGRPGKPRSHRLYVINPALPAQRFKDPVDSNAMLLEFRCLTGKEPPIGLQTVLPGSVRAANCACWIHQPSLLEWLSTPQGKNKHYQWAEVREALFLLDFLFCSNLHRSIDGVPAKASLWKGPLDLLMDDETER